MSVKYLGGDEDYVSGPYFVKITAGLTHFPFNVSIIDDDKWEQNETFYLIIDESSLPCNVTVDDQHTSAVTILDDDGREMIIIAIKILCMYNAHMLLYQLIQRKLES